MSAQLIVLLVPVAVIQIGLLVIALRDLIRRRQVVGGNKWLWALVIVFVNIVGPIIYLLAGRKEE